MKIKHQRFKRRRKNKMLEIIWKIILKLKFTKHFGCGVDDDHPYAIDDNGTDQEALENIVMEIIFIYNSQKERVFDRLRKSFES